MKDWELALQKFVNKWKAKKEVVGMLVCGSYITGRPTKHSDIDIHIILKNGITWRERGNEIIDGFLIEYFANPIEKYFEYGKEDFEHRRKIDAHMFSTGKILFDKTGDLKQLINQAKKNIKKKFLKLNKIQIELNKYHLWDLSDNMEELFEAKTKEFYFVFYNSLNLLFDIYASFLQFDSIEPNKIRRFLVNKKDKKKYSIRDFPDEKFVKLFLRLLNIKEKDLMMKEYKKLTNYVLDKMGGFNIDGWKIRSHV